MARWDLPEKIAKAVTENREFSWKYTDKDGYILYGRLPYCTKKTKQLYTTPSSLKAQHICKLIGVHGSDSGWQQLAQLANKHEQRFCPSYKPCIVDRYYPPKKAYIDS
ncbi:MAG: hypothetical protein B6247_07710 [Candidatus Parabeggiatoa sp. nov. 2]|nr:MAG: hypothetical protein B6247_07710 [Beggiatoa sp. 4572_84]